MKKNAFLLVLAVSVFTACQKERALEDRMEGHSDETQDNYGLSEKEFAHLDKIKGEIYLEIKKGDSIVINTMRNEIDSLRKEVKSLKLKK